MAKPVKFAHVVYSTRRFDEMIAWYQNVFEANVVYQNPALAFLTYDDEHHRFAFANLTVFKPASDSVARGEIGVNHVAYTYANVGELRSQHGVGSLRLDEIVDARTPAALIRIVERNKLETRNRGQDGKRSLSHTLRVLEMAGRIVRDPNGKGPAFAWPSGGEQLAHVSHACAHPHSSRVPFGIILQQMSILLHDRSATGSVDRDKGRTRALERSDIAPGE